MDGSDGSPAPLDASIRLKSARGGGNMTEEHDRMYGNRISASSGRLTLEFDIWWELGERGGEKRGVDIIGKYHRAV
jgi:hypothetical protein